ncbi:MAG: VCBS repeat-containing protein, partial [Planctomycetes bacterium]|nr:VCBS repeat-containing protein [Planctomycetota bacterium]
MRRLPIRLLPLLSLWSSLVITGCNPQPPSPAELGATNNPEAPGHERMVKRLAEYAETARKENRYYSDSLALDYGRQLAQLDARAPLQTRWKLCRLAGVAELRAGNEEKGIKLLEAAVGLLPRVGSRIGLAYAAETIFRLGVGHMRRGETLNCCARFTPESCILPIRGGGIHTDPTGSRQAIKYFARVMEMLPPDSDLYMASRWLLNIAYMTIDGYPAKVPLPYLIPESAFRSQLEIPRFKNVAPRLGLDRFNCSGGVVIDDFNNDGYLDVLSSTWEPGGQLRLFVSSGGKSFEDKTAGSGLEGIFGGLNIVQGDYDNDGNLDFLVLRGAWLGDKGRHPNSLVRNLGGLKFEDVTFSSGLGQAHYPTQTAGWADYDNDGDLDLYIGNETTRSLAAP